MAFGLLHDSDCFFGEGIPDSVLDQKKALFSEDLMNLGFLCDPKNFSNFDLRELHTWLFAFLFRQFDGLSNNQQLADCLYEQFICDRINDKFWCDAQFGGNGVGGITLPAGGPWKPFGILWAGGDNDNQFNVGGWVGQEQDNDDDLYLAFLAPSAPVAGGTFYPASAINGGVTDDVDEWSMAMFAINLGCS